MSDITIVTAFFDIGRHRWPTSIRGRQLPSYQHRGVSQYLEYFERLGRMNNRMVIYTEPSLVEKVMSIRQFHGHADKTVVIPLTEFPDKYVALKDRIGKVLTDEKFWSRVDNPHHPEYWNASYVLINLMKAFFVSNAIGRGLVKDDLTAWIDFGYCRSEDVLPKSLKWSHRFHPNKIHLFKLRPIEPLRPVEDIIKTGDVYTMGCHIVAGTKMWSKFESYMITEVEKLLDRNLIDDDQTFLLLSFLSHPEDFELHSVSPRDWFIIFKQFNEGEYVP